MQARVPNLFSLSNFIPADRCLAEQNVRVRGGRGVQWERGNEEDLQRGSKKVTLFFLLHPHSSTDLETIDFIPAFTPEEGKRCQIIRVGPEDTMWN